jgi:hypothetical protein
MGPPFYVYVRIYDTGQESVSRGCMGVGNVLNFLLCFVLLFPPQIYSPIDIHFLFFGTNWLLCCLCRSWKAPPVPRSFPPSENPDTGGAYYWHAQRRYHRIYIYFILPLLKNNKILYVL